MFCRTFIVAFVLFSTVSQQACSAEVAWPGWLGPARNGWVDYFVAPDKWPDKLDQVWQVDVGTGYSTPLVSDGLVYQYARQGGEEVLWCFELTTGDVKWRKTYPVPFTMGGGGEWHGKGPKSNPVLADGRIFTMSISGILSAWRADTGERIWHRNYDARFPGAKKTTPYWGAATSPIVDDDRVVVHFGNDDDGILAALNVETGEEVWTQSKDAPSYSSPLLVDIHGVRQIVEWNHRALVGVDRISGQQLWEYPFEHVGTDQNMPTPAFHRGRILVGGENRGLRSVEPTRVGGSWSVKENWNQDQVALDMSSAVVNDDLLFGFSHYGKGRLFCVDTKTGDILWQGPGRTGDNVAFLAIRNHVIALTDRGELQVIAATSDSYEVVASYQVSETPTWAAPTLLSDGVLIKSKESLALWKFGR